MTTTTSGTTARPPRPPAPKAFDIGFFYRREVRQVLYQVILAVCLIAFFWMIVSNARENLARQGITSGFGFFGRTSGFDISQTLIEYSNTSTYGRALWVGICNTLLVAAIGIVCATLLGFLAGIARLSSNWLIARIATVYVEVARNSPLLLQLLLWYFGVLKTLPPPRQSLNMSDSVFLNVRGLYFPKPIWEEGSGVVLGALIAAVLGAFALARWSHARQMATGQRFPVLLTALALLILLPLAAFFVMGRPATLEYPALTGFNFNGGSVLQPELVALVLGLTVYTGAYIAELVRAGIAGVAKGQKEAGLAIGLSQGQMLRLVVIPQAMRIIIPPLTSQFLNLTKNSSLAVAIAYPDLTNVGGTILNQTGQAVEMVLIMMGIYLVISLLTSAFMNWFNARMALVER